MWRYDSSVVRMVRVGVGLRDSELQFASLFQPSRIPKHTRRRTTRAKEERRGIKISAPRRPEKRDPMSALLFFAGVAGMWVDRWMMRWMDGWS